jgi:hypothetical protein
MGAEGHERVEWPTVPPREAHWIMRLFSSSRYFAAFAVLGNFLAAVTFYVCGILVVTHGRPWELGSPPGEWSVELPPVPVDRESGVDLPIDRSGQAGGATAGRRVGQGARRLARGGGTPRRG